MAHAGMAVLLVSADLEELIGLSDRIAVLFEGEITAQLDPDTITAAELGGYMTGVRQKEAVTTTEPDISKNPLDKILTEPVAPAPDGHRDGRCVAPRRVDCPRDLRFHPRRHGEEPRRCLNHDRRDRRQHRQARRDARSGHTADLFGHRRRHRLQDEPVQHRRRGAVPLRC